MAAGAFLLPVQALRAESESHQNLYIAGVLGAGRMATNVHNHISRGVLGTAELIDSFFGDVRLDEEAQDTRIKIKPSISYVDGEGLDMRTKVSVRVALPTLKHRLQLIIDEVMEEDAEDELFNQQRQLRELEDDSGSTGLRLILSDDSKSRVNLDGGVKVKSDEVKLFTRLRLSKKISFDKWSLRLTERVTLREVDGWSSRSEMRWDRPINSTWLFRSASIVRVLEEETGTRLGHSFSLFQTLSKRRALQYSLAADGITQPNNRVETYAALVTYRQRVHSDWMFFQLRPALTFPRENDFELTPAVSVALEIIFGNYP